MLFLNWYYTGVIISYIALKIFQVFFPFGIENPSLISVGGVLVSILFSFVVGISMLALAVTFMKRTNIIDVLNEQRTNESVKYQLTKKYLIIGIVCLVSGILIAGVGVQV